MGTVPSCYSPQFELMVPFFLRDTPGIWVKIAGGRMF